MICIVVWFCIRYADFQGKQDTLAIDLVGEKELGVQFLENSFAGPARRFKPIFWKRRIGIVRRYVEGAG